MDESSEIPAVERTLFLALTIPDVPASWDADDLADHLARLLTDARQIEGASEGRVMVNGIPGPQWLTAKTLANLRAAARGERS